MYDVRCTKFDDMFKDNSSTELQDSRISYSHFLIGVSR